MAKKASSPRPRSNSFSTAASPAAPKEQREQVRDCWSAIPQKRQTRRSIVFLITGALILLAFAVFWPAAHNEFVNYDDPDYVTSNPHVQGGFTTENLKWAFSTGPDHASNWHPLTWLSHMLDYSLFK